MISFYKFHILVFTLGLSLCAYAYANFANKTTVERMSDKLDKIFDKQSEVREDISEIKGILSEMRKL